MQFHFFPVSLADWAMSSVLQVMKRYEGTFGERNHKFTLGKVEFVAIDAQSIDGNPNIFYHTTSLLHTCLVSNQQAFYYGVDMVVEVFSRCL